jgi:DNA repair protein RecN (Recombination protein N)
VLTELFVRDLGVIAESRLELGPGMTALTGETGAGKTMLVDAIELLVGGRADPSMVRRGSPEARVDGRFDLSDLTGEVPGGDLQNRDEVVLSRVIPTTGRSRAYVDGRPATATELADWGRRLVDLHGQHAHQSLLSTRVQRDVLDAFGSIDLAPWKATQRAVADIDAELAAMGGDPRARAREIDLYRFQVAELDAAALTVADEDEALAREHDELADADAHREAAATAVDALSSDGGALDLVAGAAAALVDRAPFAEIDERLRGLAAELTDVTAELRDRGEGIEQDPERLASIRERRQLLRDLRRKYGESLEDVLAYADEARGRLAELESHDERARALDIERQNAVEAERRAAQVVGDARRAAAPRLASAIEEQLATLAMDAAQVEVSVSDEPAGDHVEMRLAANKGGPLLPLAKAASGGELARTMLGIRLVLTAGPPVLVFDEVDAGIGGAAAVAVGRALAALAPGHQVLVVTHLPQVAAHAHAQVAVAKHDEAEATISEARLLDSDERVIELSRMLSGDSGSDAAREHAAELLHNAGRSAS